VPGLTFGIVILIFYVDVFVSVVLIRVLEAVIFHVTLQTGMGRRRMGLGKKRKGASGQAGDDVCTIAFGPLGMTCCSPFCNYGLGVEKLKARISGRWVGQPQSVIGSCNK
jgi:hypothetical protein